MTTHLRRSTRSAALLASLSLAFASVGIAQAQEASPEASSAAMSVDVAGLEPGAVVTANEIDLSVTPVGYEFSAAHVGSPPVAGLGNYDVLLDGGLIDIFATTDSSISLQNVTPGPHTLMVVPARNDNTAVPEGAVSLDFDYQPSDPLPQITGSDAAGGTPAISIVSPAPGDTVSGDFDLTFDVTDFELSSALIGKPLVDGMGHLHIFLDAADDLSTLLGMTGTDTFTVHTQAMTPGTHTFIVVLADNLHGSFDPPIVATIDLDVAASDDAAAEASADEGAIAVSLTEYALDPSVIELEAGSFTFDGVNAGTIPHGLVIEGEGIRAATPDMSYGVGASESFTVDLAPGTYEMYCPVPGHREAGMSGMVTVAA